jgi:hypothetical protein
MCMEVVQVISMLQLQYFHKHVLMEASSLFSLWDRDALLPVLTSESCAFVFRIIDRLEPG